MGYDPDEDKTWRTWLQWLQAWEHDPLRPSIEFQQWIDEQRLTRAGGYDEPPPEISDLTRGKAGARTPQNAKRAQEAVSDALLYPSTLKYDPHAGGKTPPVIGGGSYKEDRKRAQLHFISSKLAIGSRSIYQSGWKLWCWFLTARGGSPFLTGKEGPATTKDEEVILDFIVHLVQLFHRTEGTLRTNLMAIRHHHLLAGLPDPLRSKERVWLALGGIKHLQGTVSRRLPVTVRMLRWLHSVYSQRSNDDFVTYAAGIIAWFLPPKNGRIRHP